MLEAREEHWVTPFPRRIRRKPCFEEFKRTTWVVQFLHGGRAAKPVAYQSHFALALRLSGLLLYPISHYQAPVTSVPRLRVRCTLTVILTQVTRPVSAPAFSNDDATPHFCFFRAGSRDRESERLPPAWRCDKNLSVVQIGAAFCSNYKERINK